MAPEMRPILAAKYAAPRLGTLSDGELFDATAALIYKIHVITGWAIPPDANLQVLIDQLAKKCRESYANVNSEEFEFAFRNNTTVKDWGKAMNLALLDEVLTPYLAQRAEVSKTEERAALPAPAPIVDIEMSDDDLLEATYQSWRLIKSVHIIPVSLYYFLTASGMWTLTQQQKNQIRDRTPRNGLSLEAFYDVCRKVAVEDYFKSLSAPVFFKMGDSSQWEEIKP